MKELYVDKNCLQEWFYLYNQKFDDRAEIKLIPYWIAVIVQNQKIKQVIQKDTKLDIETVHLLKNKEAQLWFVRKNSCVRLKRGETIIISIYNVHYLYDYLIKNNVRNSQEFENMLLHYLIRDKYYELEELGIRAKRTCDSKKI